MKGCHGRWPTERSADSVLVQVRQSEFRTRSPGLQNSPKPNRPDSEMGPDPDSLRSIQNMMGNGCITQVVQRPDVG